ncbi:MAG: fibronectin type III domain-containing protein, partial [Planctomycetaceae bacterium]|nr:fibronectin type III domain-containing protein [Planctomycetaceae bacterium]
MAGSSGTTIRNGSIVQGQGNGLASLPIYAEYAYGLTVQGVNTFSTGIDTGAIDAKYPSGGLTISGCVFKSTSDKVTNRMAMMGALAQVAFSSDAVVVDNNQFIDSPQIGIFASGNDNLKITNNTIKSNSIATDGYGILCNNVHNFVISGNTITADVGKSSRGILLDGYSGVTYNGEIFDNYVDIRERPNPEYGAIGLEATALRLRTWMDAGWHDLHIYNNTFIARTGDGEVHEAIGLRIYMPSNTPGADMNVLIENNTFKGIVDSTNSFYSARAVSLEEVGAICSPLFKNNTFESNDTSLGLGGNDGKDAFDGDFFSNTFSKSSEGATRTYYAVTAGYWNGSVQNVVISDPKYINGATQTIDFPSDYAPADGTTRTVSFGGALAVSVTDTSGKALAGATVTVLDKNGAKVYSGTTDASGQLAGVQLPATTYRQSTTNPDTVTSDGSGPFQVSVSLAGYTTATQTVTQSGTAQFQLPPSGTTVTVNAPSGLTATGTASPASISLSWINNAANATSFSVERSTGSAGTWTVVASGLAATAKTYTDSSVTAGTTYTYRVRAFAGSTASGYSNVASATVPNSLPNAPAAPTNLAAAATASSVSLTWTNNASNATAYSVERSIGSTGAWSIVASNLAATATSYTDSSVTAGAAYSYRVQAFAGTTGSAYSNVASATVPGGTTTAPAAPTNLAATPNASAGGISLSWTNNATNATSYSIERFSGGTGLWGVVVSNLSGTATSFVDNTVTPATFYTYRVQALASTTPSAYSNMAWATAPNVQPTAPAAPTNLTATATASPLAVALSWT